MPDFMMILTVLWNITRAAMYFIEGVVRALIPSEYLPKKDISNEIALVTGAGSGIGREIAKCLAREGCRLILWDVDEKGNNETKQTIEKLGGEAFTYTVDVSKRDVVYSFAKRVREEVGEVSLLVNNAGILSMGAVSSTPDERIQKMFEVNTLAHFWTVKAFIPSMLERDHGHIVGMISIVGLAAMPIVAGYSSSKFACYGFLEALDLELRFLSDNLHVTKICLSGVDTPMTRNIRDNVPERLQHDRFQSPAGEVARRIVMAVRTNETLLMYPLIETYTMALLKRYLPPKALFTLLEKAFPGQDDLHHYNVADRSHNKQQ